VQHFRQRFQTISSIMSCLCLVHLILFYTTSHFASQTYNSIFYVILIGLWVVILIGNQTTLVNRINSNNLIMGGRGEDAFVYNLDKPITIPEMELDSPLAYCE